MIDNNLRHYIETIPKADLHTHLDSLAPHLLLRLGKRNGVDLPFRSIEEFNRWYVLEDLDDFMEKFKTLTSVLRNEEDYRDVVVELGQSLKRQNVIHCESMFTYTAAHEGRVELDVVMKGLAQGRKEVRDELGVNIDFLADVDRTISPERSLRFVEEIVPYKEEVGLVGVGFDCEETGYPVGVHKAAIELAREHGFFLSAHAGEEYSAGPEAVWEVIENMSPDRIDHGTQAIRDARLVEYLAGAQIPLTLCPISNVALQVYGSIEEHPVIDLWNKGVFVTINADDVTMMKGQNDLVFNYTCVAEAFNLTFNDIADLARNSFQASYADTKSKEAYMKRLDEWRTDNAKPEVTKAV